MMWVKMSRYDKAMHLYVQVDEQQYILRLDKLERRILIAGAEETDGIVAWADENGLVRESMDDSPFFGTYRKKTVGEAYSGATGIRHSIYVIAKTSGIQKRCILPIMDKEVVSKMTYNLRWGFTYSDVSNVMLGKNIRSFSFIPRHAQESYCYSIRTDATSEFLDLVRKSL
jgi:hypothetical protein